MRLLFHRGPLGLHGRDPAGRTLQVPDVPDFLPSMGVLAIHNLSNKVLVFVESKTASSQKMPGGLKDLLGRVTNKQGMVQFYPCIWPDTASTALTNKMKEIIARVHTEVNEGMSPGQMIQKCMDIASKSAHAAQYFCRHALPPDSK